MIGFSYRMSATDRALLLLEQADMQKLAVPNTKEYARWSNIKRGRARMGVDEAEELAKLFPEYSLWLISGKTCPEAGQISPDLKETVSEYGRTGTATD